MHTRAFDSAKTTLKVEVVLPAIGALRGVQNVQPMHMNILLRGIVLVWADEAVDLVYASAAIPSSSTDAACVHGVLELCEQVVAENDIVKELMATALFPATLDACDGAYSNLKYENWVALDDEVNHVVGWNPVENDL